MPTEMGCRRQLTAPDNPPAQIGTDVLRPCLPLVGQPTAVAQRD